MGKHDLKVKRVRAKGEDVSFESRLSPDKRTFVLRIESGRPMSWYDCVLACFVWASDERERLTIESNTTEH